MTNGNSTTQSSLTQSLFRIEPTQGFVDYVQATKPYHTKIMDILVEYIYEEDLDVTIRDRLTWVMELSRPNTQIVYSCGYGFIWDPLPTLATPDSPVTPVVIEEAVADVMAPPYPITDVQPFFETFTVSGDATTIFTPGKTFTVSGSTGNDGPWTVASSTFTISGTVITVTGNITNAVVDGVITVQTVYPITGVDTGLETFTVAGDATDTFTVGRIFGVQASTGNNGVYTVVSSVFALGFTTITVVEDITNATADGVISIQTNTNSFLIQPAAFVPFNVAAVSISTNQLVLCGENYDVVGVDVGAGEWELDDPNETLVAELTSGTLPKVIYISSDTGPVGNGPYTVTGSSWLAGVTTITVAEAIPVQANGDGVLHRPLESVLTFPITAVVTGSPGTWVFSGHAANLPGLQPGKRFTISGNTGGADGSYIVVSATNVGVTTEVEVLNIDGAATADGNLIVQELPSWPAGQAVTFNLVSGTLPAPIVAGQRYYFQPSTIAGRFNLSTLRYPSQYSHFIDLGTLGTGTFTVERNETFIPGTQVIVTSTYLHRNDGVYIIRDTAIEGSNERVYVYQKVNASTPPAALTDGLMVFDVQGYDEPIYCPPAQMPDFYADTFIHETLKFTFELSPVEAMYATYGENLPRGFGETMYGDALLGSFGTYADSFDPRTAQTSGLPGADSAHTVLPTGIDTQLFDVGGIDETLQTVRHFYGR